MCYFSTLCNKAEVESKTEVVPVKECIVTKGPSLISGAQDP